MKPDHAMEQDRPDILTRCDKWFDGDLDLKRLVFTDAIRASVRMAPRASASNSAAAVKPVAELFHLQSRV